MKKLRKTVIAILAMWVVVTNMYVMATHADRVLDSGADVHAVLKYPLYAGAAVGVVADIAFNVSAGTVIFQEFPQELLFTARATRHLQSTGYRQERAIFWCGQLDLFDKGHCDGFKTTK